MFIEITHDCKEFKVSKAKILFVLNKLTNKKLENLKESELLSLMKKFSLMDEYFLEKLSKN